MFSKSPSPAATSESISLQREGEEFSFPHKASSPLSSPRLGSGSSLPFFYSSGFLHTKDLESKLEWPTNRGSTRQLPLQLEEGLRGRPLDHYWAAEGSGLRETKSRGPAEDASQPFPPFNSLRHCTTPGGTEEKNSKAPVFYSISCIFFLLDTKVPGCNFSLSTCQSCPPTAQNW